MFIWNFYLNKDASLIWSKLLNWDLNLGSLHCKTSTQPQYQKQLKCCLSCTLSLLLAYDYIKNYSLEQIVFVLSFP